MMGGLIEVSSQPGVGSSFHFALEFTIADVVRGPPALEDARHDRPGCGAGPADLYLAHRDAMPDQDYSANLPASAAVDRIEEEIIKAPLPAELPGLAIQQGLVRVGNNEKLFLQLLADLLKE